MRSAIAVVLWVVPFLGCQRDAADVAAAKTRDDRPAPGLERGDCRPDKTCDVGLLCLSNLCVAPPPGDCAAIAETLASLELGNYAPREERARIVGEKRATCEKVRVTKDEEKCIDEAAKKRDKWEIAKCVPRLVPAWAPSGGNEATCSQIVKNLTAAMTRTANDPSTQQTVARAAEAVRASCMMDGWPDALRDCMFKIDPNASVDAIRSCEAFMPPGLEEKLQRRMTGAVVP